MRLDLSFADAALAREMPMGAPALKAFVRAVARDLRKLPEWAETVEILGRRPVCVALYVCDDLEMRRIHRDFRNLDKTTDVLSFPARESPDPNVDALAEDASLGDLVVAWPTVLRAAKRVRRPAREELAEVLAHGMLHLLGLDHVGVPKAAAARMKALQKRLSRAALKSIKSAHGR